MRSAAWNFSCMAIPSKWIRALFSEEHWKTESDPLHIPFRPVLSSTALVDNETGRDGEESCMSREMPSMGPLPKKRVRQRGDVVVQIPARRPEQNREKRRDLIRRRLPRNGCKIVGLGAQRGPISQGVSSANILWKVLLYGRWSMVLQVAIVRHLQTRIIKTQMLR